MPNAVPQSFPDDYHPVGVYVHIPFCLSRCDYCGFVSYPFNPMLEDAYVEGVLMEIENKKVSHLFGNYGSSQSVDTIYFGGGTPSVFSPASIKRLINTIKNTFKPVHPLEITMEINPGTYTDVEFSELYEFGVNRISIGAQSLNDCELDSMNRPHSSSDFLKVFAGARSGGFNNISVDLLAGYPGQTIESVVDSIDRVIELGPEHVSVYMLDIKSGSKIEKRIKLNQDKPIDDDLVADMYETICEKLCHQGFEQYEISNFCKQGMVSRHNVKYWTDKVFLGFGVAAHGMTGKARYSNVVNLNDYMVAVSSNGSAIESFTKMDPLTRFKDAMIMGLRMTQGVDFRIMSSRYGFDSYFFVKQTLLDLMGTGLFTMGRDTIKLTPKGMLLSNIIFTRFV
ncbi:MAG: radical SAM family heme chaperone HemW [Desulfomonilaceae bacterium]